MAGGQRRYCPFWYSLRVALVIVFHAWACCSLYTLREDKIAHVRVLPFDAGRESGRVANRGLRSIRRVAVAHTAPAHGDDYVPIH